MNESYIRNVVEAAMLAAGRPMQVLELAELFDEASRPAVSDIRAALATLEEDYTGRGIELKETANGFRIQVRRDLANEISRLWPERPPKYSRALLETMALIAYRQPITRAEIEAVRGVAVNPNIIKTLLERNWVRVVGQRDVPGRPELLGTTKDFLDYFGLRSLDELPPLAELKAMGDVNLQLDLAKNAVATDAVDSEGDDAVEGAGVDAAPNVVAVAHVVADEAVAPADADAAEVAVVAAASEEGATEIADIADLEALVEAGESPADADDEFSVDAPEPVGAGAAEHDAGPKRRAAEAFVAEIDADDAEGSGNDDDSSDEDELSADSEGSKELVASPPRYDD